MLFVKGVRGWVVWVGWRGGGDLWGCGDGWMGDEGGGLGRFGERGLRRGGDGRGWGGFGVFGWRLLRVCGAGGGESFFYGRCMD